MISTKTKTIIAAILCCFSFTKAHCTHRPRPNNVCLYQQINFQGEPKCFRVRTSGNLCDSEHGGCRGAWNDKVKSIKIGSKVKELKIYKHSGFVQFVTAFTSNVHCLTAAQQQFTSFRVIQGVPRGKDICIYTQKEFMGKRKCFKAGAQINLCKSRYGGCWGSWNDKIRSIQGGCANTPLLLYKHSNYDTFSTVLTAETTNLPSQYHGTTCIRVQKPNKACLYQKENYEGPGQKCFKKGANVDLCHKAHGGCHGKWNDDVRSVFLGPNVNSVKAYKHSGFNHYLCQLTESKQTLSSALHSLTSLRVR